MQKSDLSKLAFLWPFDPRSKQGIMVLRWPIYITPYNKIIVNYFSQKSPGSKNTERPEKRGNKYNRDGKGRPSRQKRAIITLRKRVTINILWFQESTKRYIWSQVCYKARTEARPSWLKSSKKNAQFSGTDFEIASGTRFPLFLPCSR